MASRPFWGISLSPVVNAALAFILSAFSQTFAKCPLILQLLHVLSYAGQFSRRIGFPSGWACLPHPLHLRLLFSLLLVWFPFDWVRLYCDCAAAKELCEEGLCSSKADSSVVSHAWIRLIFASRVSKVTTSDSIRD